MKQAIVSSVLVAGLALGTAGSAYAAKGGNGNNQQASAPSATLSSSCESVCVTREAIYFTGAGYDAAQGKALLQINALWSSVGVEDDGTVDFVWGSGLGIPGEYTVQLYQNGKGKRLELKGETTVIIE